MSDTPSETEASHPNQSGEVETELSRDMSLADITFIGVGAMIGAGVFALTGFAAGLAGPALPLAFALNGVVATFIAIPYAELGAAFPEAGGGYLWVKEALVNPNGFYAGWMSWFAHAVAASLYAVTFGVFFTEFFVSVVFPGQLAHDFVLYGFITRHMTEKAVAVVIILAFSYINFRGAEETGTAAIVVTSIKLIILGFFVIFGVLATVQQPNWPAIFLDRPEFAPEGIVGILGAMGFTMIAFEGYEIIVQSGEEVVNPGETIPKAVFYSLIIVIPIYVFVAFAAIGGVDVTSQVLEIAGINQPPSEVFVWQLLGELGELGLIRAAGQFLPYGVPLLIIAGLSATTSALNATVYSSSRVSFAMGRDRALPGNFDNIHPEKKTPYYALLFSTILIVAMAVLLPIESVAVAADIMFILLFLQVNWTVIKMRHTHPDLPRTFEIPYMPWPPLIGMILLVTLMPFLVYSLGLEAVGLTPPGSGNEGLYALMVTVIWMALGLVVYYGYSKQQETEQLEEETPTVVAEQAPSNADQQLVVPIANPENAPQLMRTAVDIVEDRGGELLVMNVITVPRQTPLSHGRQFISDERELLNEAMEIAEAEDVPVSGTIRIGHDVSQAILNTIDQYGSDAVLMGWKGQHKSQRRDIVLGSNVDTIAQEADADVLVERLGTDATGDAETILLPTAGGPHAEFAAEIASAITDNDSSRIDIVHVVDPSADERKRQEAEELLAATKDHIEDAGEITTQILEGDDVVETIVDEYDSYDMTLVGATREGLLTQLVFGSVPEQIGWKANSTVLMAKRHLGITSLIERWL